MSGDIYPLRRRARAVAHVEWVAPDEVPGGVLPADVERRLADYCRDADQRHRRAAARLVAGGER